VLCLVFFLFINRSFIKALVTFSPFFSSFFLCACSSCLLFLPHSCYREMEREGEDVGDQWLWPAMAMGRAARSTVVRSKQ